MEQLGIEGGSDETSALQESVSLKAFLRVDKDSRRDYLLSTIEPDSKPIQSPEAFQGSSETVVNYSTATATDAASKFQSMQTSTVEENQVSTSMTTHTSEMNNSILNNSHAKFSLSYDPRDSVFKSTQSPIQASDYFQDLSTDESKLPVNQSFSTQYDGEYLNEKDSRSKVAENFNAMNTIINSTFKEKIDYQRKLREQQSELNILKDKIHRLRSENSHLAKTINKNKQSNLPLAMSNIYKKRRLAIIRRGLSRWQDFTRGSSLAYIKNMEADFRIKEADYLHNGRLVVMKLRSSTFRTLGIIYARRRQEIFRKAFSKWFITVSVSAHNQQQKDNVASHCVAVMMRSRTSYHTFTSWKKVFTRKRALNSLIRKMGIYDRKRTLRAFCALWKLKVLQFHQAKSIQTSLRTLMRHSSVSDCFKVWKHKYCDVYFPHRNTAMKSVWRRCCRMRMDFLHASFSKWCKITLLEKKNQLKVALLVRNFRRNIFRWALKRWHQSIECLLTKRQLLCKVLNDYSMKNMQVSKCLVFSRWKQYAILVDKHKHARDLHERELHLQIMSDQYSANKSQLEETHTTNTSITLHRASIIIQALKVLGCNHKRLHRLMIAFKRWSYISLINENVKNSLTVCYTRRVVAMLGARLKSHCTTALTKWKDFVKQRNIHEKVVLRLLRSNYKQSALIAFRKWKEFRYVHHVQSIANEWKKERVLQSVRRWQHIRIHVPLQKWKEVTFYLRSRNASLVRTLSIACRLYIRLSFQKWHRVTVFNDLLEHKSCLEKYQAVKFKNIELYVGKAHIKCKNRILRKWKSYTSYCRRVKKAATIRSYQTSTAICKKVLFKWKYHFDLRQKFSGGLRIIISFVSGADTMRRLKYFNRWARAVTSQSNGEMKEALFSLKQRYVKSEDALMMSHSQCNDANAEIISLSEQRISLQQGIAKSDHYMESFALLVSYRRHVSIFFNCWKERYYKYRSCRGGLSNAIRHVICRMDSYCVRQRFLKWKMKVVKSQSFLRAFSRFERKVQYCQCMFAFRKLRNHSVACYMAAMAEKSLKESSEKAVETLLHQNAKIELHRIVVLMNSWKKYTSLSLGRKKKLQECAMVIEKRDVIAVFRQWKIFYWNGLTLERALHKIVKVKLYTHFTHWQRTHKKILQLDAVELRWRRWQCRKCLKFFRSWLAYCGQIKINRAIFRSLFLTMKKREDSVTQKAFTLWKGMSLACRALDHKMSLLENRTRGRALFSTFEKWRNQLSVRQVYRKNREEVVHGISQSLPIVKNLYDILFSVDSIDESVAISTAALERILPEYSAEIYVLVSNTMLRASVPLKKSVNGSFSRFSSHHYDTGGGSSPMHIPSSPIYREMKIDNAFPPSPSFSHSHILPTTSPAQPWSTEKQTLNHSVDNVYNTPHHFHPPTEDTDNTEIVSVIVGRGNVGECAKTGCYQVYRNVTSNSLSPDKRKLNVSSESYIAHSSDISAIVVPLISSNCIVGVLQLTPLRSRVSDTDATKQFRPNSPVSFPYPSTSNSVPFSYPFPSPPPFPNSFGSIPPSHLQSQANSSSYSQFHRTSHFPLPPPQFTELINMCMDVNISDVSKISQLCIVVGTLSDNIHMHIEGNLKKSDLMAAAVAEREKLEAYIAQLHGEVSSFEESIGKSSKRIEHLEKSRLRYFNECKAFKEKAESHEKDIASLTQTLAECREKLGRYEDKERSEGVVMEKLHQSLTKATLEVFGTPAASSNNSNVMSGNDMDTRQYQTTNTNNHSLKRESENTFNTSNNTQFSSRRISGEDHSIHRSRQNDILVDTATPASRLPYPMNTLTTYDTSSRFSPSHIGNDGGYHSNSQNFSQR